MSSEGDLLEELAKMNRLVDLHKVIFEVFPRRMASG